MPLFEFEGCRQRIRRAEAHSETLAKLWNDNATEEGFYSVRVCMYEDGTGSIRLDPIYGWEFLNIASLELGEMLYQLRAALDSCIYSARIRETGQNPPPDEDKLEFPICKKRADFKAFNRAPLADKRRDILESVQPYKIPKLVPEEMVFNFNRTLAILNDWARKDRHRRLHMVGSWASNASPKIRCPEGTTLSYIRINGAGFLEHKNEIATFGLIGYREGMEVQANPDVAIDIAVDEIPPPCADNDTLGNRIRAMLMATKFIVSAMEDTF